MRRIDWLAVAAVLLFAAALRIPGISYGALNPAYFPSYAPKGMAHEMLPIQPDEYLSVALPVNMALRNRLNPDFFEYPSFIINTNFLLFQLTNALDGISLADRDGSSLRVYAAFPLYVFSRMISVFGGMLMVACAYAISKAAVGPFAALCAGLLVAVSYTLVQHAHYIKPGSLAAGWMTLAAWACIMSLYARRSRSRRRLYILAGVVTGLAATTRYNALAVAPLFLCAGLLHLHRRRSRRTLLATILAWFMVPLIFFLGSPYILRDFDRFWADFSYIVGQFTTTGRNVPEYFLVDPWTGLMVLLLYASLFAIGLPAIILAVVSLAEIPRGRLPGGFLKRNSIGLYVALVAVMVAAYMLVAMRTIRPGHSDNLLLLILPFLALLSAAGADWLAKRSPWPRALTMPAIALILIAQPLVLSVQVTRMFTQPDTRHLMLDWIHERIPQGSRFFLNGPYNVPLDEARYFSRPQYGRYAAELPDGAEYDYMIYSDALAFDVLRSVDIVPPAVIQEQRDYLRRLDANFRRAAEIIRPAWTGSEAMINTAAYWHNPTLILYCLNRQSCEALR